MTGRKTGIVGDESAGDEGDPRTAELDRVSAKLERLSAQRKALRQAMGQFGDDFDAKAWTKAFDSPDPPPAATPA
jgi:hypothetical protein